MEIDPSIWMEGLRPFEIVLQKGRPNWTWTSGGCFAFASAFQAAFGGEFYGVCRIWEEDGEIDYPVDHALVLMDGIFYDHNGPFDVANILPGQVIKHREDDLVGWFEDDFFDDQQWKEIHSILLGCSLELNQPLQIRQRT